MAGRSNAPVRTTLNQCRRRGPVHLAGRVGALPDGTYPLSAGTAFRHDGLVYRVIEGSGTLRLGPQTGAWRDCGVGSPSLPAILANTPALQAVWHAGDELGQAVFYKPGAIAFPDGLRVETDQACLLVYRPDRTGRLVFTLAQPDPRKGLITLRLQGLATGSLSASLPAREYAGASFTLAWQA